MSVNKSEQNEVVSILMYIIKLRQTLVERQSISWLKISDVRFTKMYFRNGDRRMKC